VIVKLVVPSGACGGSLPAVCRYLAGGHIEEAEVLLGWGGLPRVGRAPRQRWWSMRAIGGVIHISCRKIANSRACGRRADHIVPLQATESSVRVALVLFGLPVRGVTHNKNLRTFARFGGHLRPGRSQLRPM